jgi:hypothetical protein
LVSSLTSCQTMLIKVAPQLPQSRPTNAFISCNHPPCVSRLEQEMDKRVGGDGESSSVTCGVAKKLSYLGINFCLDPTRRAFHSDLIQAVIYETVRHHLPLFAHLAKILTSSGDTLLGRFVPGGSRISGN